MDTKIIEQLKEALAEEFSLVRHNFGQLEQVVMQKIQLLGQGLLQRLVNEQPNGYKGSQIGCKCGGYMEFVQHRSRDIHTLVGWITVKRAYYHCPDCGAVAVPYDQESGLGAEKVSPALANVCCLIAVDDSFEQVSRKVRQLFGQSVSDDTIKRLVHGAGHIALRKNKQRFEDLQVNGQKQRFVPDRLYVVADGTTVHEEDGWHEAKTGCVYWDDKRFVRHKRYISSFDNSDGFGRTLWLEAVKCGLQQAKEVVYIGDGAGWIRSLHRSRFGRATFIIDWFHASEHIWDCGKILFGEGTQQTKRWGQRQTSLLWDGWTRKLLNDLASRRKKYRGQKRDAIDALHHYISTNEEQMRYNVFRDKGYDIGSGAAEGACKHVVASRLKQSGMIWSRPGSSAVLALRTTWLNGEWNRLWQLKPLAA